MFVLAPDGKIMYISETASVHLGMAQVRHIFFFFSIYSSNVISNIRIPNYNGILSK